MVVSLKNVLRRIKDELAVRVHPIKELELDDKYLYLVGLGMVVLGEGVTFDKKQTAKLNTVARALSLPVDQAERAVADAQLKEMSTMKALVHLLSTRELQALFILEAVQIAPKIDQETRNLCMDIFRLRMKEQEGFSQLIHGIESKDVKSMLPTIDMIPLDLRKMARSIAYLLPEESSKVAQELEHYAVALTGEKEENERALGEKQREIEELSKQMKLAPSFKETIGRSIEEVAPEELEVTIRHAKEKFREQFVDDLKELRNQFSYLADVVAQSDFQIRKYEEIVTYLSEHLYS